MSLATAMYHSEKNPLKQITYKSEKLYIPKDREQRKAHKTLLRYHDPENWPSLRVKLKEMGRGDLIGNGPNQLVADDAEQSRGQMRRSKVARPGQKTGNRPHRSAAGKKAAQRPGLGAKAGAGKSGGKGKAGTANKGRRK